MYIHLLDWKPGATCDLWQLSLANAKRANFLESGDPVNLSHSHVFGLRLFIRNTNPAHSPDIVIVFEAAEPLQVNL